MASKADSMNRKRNTTSDAQMRQIGLAMSIPMLLAAGPLVGFGLGWLVRRWTGWGVWVTVVFLLLGMVAGIRETIKVIRKVS